MEVAPDTGQITTVFDHNPQLPFGTLHLALKSGPRAPLIAPDSCDSYEIETTFTGWSGRVVTGKAPFTISNGCPSGAFSHTFPHGEGKDFRLHDAG